MCETSRPPLFRTADQGKSYLCDILRKSLVLYGFRRIFHRFGKVNKREKEFPKNIVENEQLTGRSTVAIMKAIHEGVAS